MPVPGTPVSGVGGLFRDFRPTRKYAYRFLIPSKEEESNRREPGGNRCQPNQFSAKPNQQNQTEEIKPSIEYKPTAAATFDPWKRTTVKTYSDELLRPELADRQLRLKEGPNWMRIIPASVSGSGHWMHGLHILETPTGKFVHPRTFESGNRTVSIWDAVYGLLRKTAPEKLFSKANPEGWRLLPKPMSLCWVITRDGMADDSPQVVRLLTLSGYSGERGGVQGMGYQILKLAEDLDENGDLAHNILGAADGVQVCVEKIVSKESKFPRYVLRAGRQPSPISDVLAQLPESETAILQPLADVVRRMTEEEQWERLAHLLPADEVAVLREAIEQ